MNKVQRISILRDMRISLEENWEKVVVCAIKEAQARGQLVTPQSIFNDNGFIIGWKLHGWKPYTVVSSNGRTTLS